MREIKSNVEGIRPVCDICVEIMSDFGALIFTPPIGQEVKKYHICIRCYDLHIDPLILNKIPIDRAAQVTGFDPV